MESCFEAAAVLRNAGEVITFVQSPDGEVTAVIVRFKALGNSSFANGKRTGASH